MKLSRKKNMKRRYKNIINIYHLQKSHIISSFDK